MGQDWVKEAPSMVGAYLMLAACLYLGGATLVNIVKSREDEKEGRIYAPPADVSLLDQNPLS